jgi:hypothetical protein
LLCYEFLEWNRTNKPQDFSGDWVLPPVFGPILRTARQYPWPIGKESARMIVLL